MYVCTCVCVCVCVCVYVCVCESIRSYSQQHKLLELLGDWGGMCVCV